MTNTKASGVPMSTINEPVSDKELEALEELVQTAGCLYDCNKREYQNILMRATPGIKSRQVVAILHALIKLGLVTSSE